MIKAKDKYRVAKMLIEGGSVKKLNELFDYIPKSVVAKELGIHYYSLLNKLKNIGKFTLGELCTLANLIGVKEITIIDLAHAQNLSNKQGK